MTAHKKLNGELPFVPNKVGNIRQIKKETIGLRNFNQTHMGSVAETYLCQWIAPLQNIIILRAK